MKKQGLSIPAKIKWMSVVAVISLVSVSYMAHDKISEMHATTVNLYDHPYAVSNSLKEIKAAHYAVLTELYKLKANQSNAVESKEIITTGIETMNDEVQVVKESFLGDPAKVQELEKHIGNWGVLVKDAVASSQKGNWSLYESQLTNVMGEANENLTNTLSGVLTFALEKGKDFMARANRNIKSVQMLFLLTVLVASVVFIIIAVFTFRSIVKLLCRVSQRLSEGSKELRLKAEEFKQSSQTLSSTVSDQASSLQETAASLEELSSMVKNNVGQAEAAQKSSKEVKDSSKESLGKIQELEQAMKEIVKGNEDLESLLQVIEEVGEKTKVIDDIVFQTKILSVNANVEAEKAGEYGKGFSVVAQEVSDLAEMSGKASREISQMVKDGAKSANKIYSNNHERVKEGAERLKEVVTTFGKLQEVADEILEGSKQILAASKDQSAGITEVNTAVSQLDSATQQNSGLATQTAASSKELISYSAQLENIVEDLIVAIGEKQEEGAEKGPAKAEGLPNFSGSAEKSQDNIYSLPTKRDSSQVSSSDDESADNDKAWGEI